MDSTSEIRLKNKETHLYCQRQVLTALLLCAVFLLPILSLAARDRSYSEAENRSLAQRPQLTFDAVRTGSFFSSFSDYLADQLWGRDGWITLDTFGQRLLGRKEVNNVFLGSDGYLFAAPEIPDAERSAAKLAAVNGFASQHPELSVSLMLVPDSAAVLTEKLPTNAPLRDQAADIEAVRQSLSPDLRFLDVLPALRQHADEEIYYHTDHHWTSLGAWYAFGAFSDVFTGGIAIPAYDVLTVSDDFEGTLSSRSGVHGSRDHIEVYLPQNGPDYYVYYPDSQTKVTSMFRSEALDGKDKYTVFFGGNHPITEIWSAAGTGRDLLVFKDSYANAFIQFLTPYYDSIILIDPRYYYGDLSTVMSSYNISDVLFLYSADTWQTDTTLTDLLATDE